MKEDCHLLVEFPTSSMFHEFHQYVYTNLFLYLCMYLMYSLYTVHGPVASNTE